MDRKTKERALDLLEAKRSDPSITYADIARKTGYSRRQLMRMAAELEGRGRQAALEHGNAGRPPSTAATEAGPGFMRELKRPYPSITIAHFRDIFLEDVLGNPDRAGDVERYGLRPRSASWFRDLFAREGWVSPASRPERSYGGRVSHPIREPLPRRGMMLQADATPHDWLGSGRSWSPRLAVDDATTEVCGGWLVPRECTRGYARMMAAVLRSRGVPESIYSDRHSVFRSTKGGDRARFALMMGDLGVRMIFAESPEAKGRVERYMRTAQPRLSNDIVRFGVRDHDGLNERLDGPYAAYLNAKLAFPPRDPRDAFAPVAPGFDYSSVFRTRDSRQARGGMVSVAKVLYYLIDGDGVLFDPGEGAEVGVHVDALTEEMYAERAGVRYSLVPAGARGREEPSGPQAVANQKELQQLLRALREG